MKMSPLLEFFTREPQKEQANTATDDIHHHIRNQCGAAGDVDLMQFIAGGVQEQDGQGETGFIPTPGAADVFLWLPDGAPCQHGENAVFHHVTTFAEEVVQFPDVRLRHMGKQPAHQRFKQRGRMPGGIGITGSGEDHAHPDEQRQPVDQKF